MKLTVVDKVPEKRCARKNIVGYLDEFMKMNVKVVKVEFNKKEYKQIQGCQSSFSKAIKKNGYPVIATQKNKELYLIRNDM